MIFLRRYYPNAYSIILYFIPRYIKLIYFLLAVLSAVLMMYIPMDMSVYTRKILGVTIFMMILFITEAMPFAVTGLSGCYLYWAWCGLPLAKSFSGFTNDTPWFILGVLFIGAMAKKTELPKHMAYYLLSKFAASYSSILFGLLLTDLILTFIIPSGAARVVILCTIALGLVHTFGLDIKSNVAKGMILTLTYSATIFDKFILAGAASILARGLIESIGNVEISWGMWFIAYFPLTLLTLLACWYFTLKLFPPEINIIHNGESLINEELKKLGPMTKDQYKVFFVIIIATILWSTDFIHNINPSVIGIGFGIIGFLPVIGVLDTNDLAEINFPIIIFIGSILSMGKILLDSSLLNNITDVLFNWMVLSVHNESAVSAIMYWYANFFHLFLGNESAMLSASLPAVVQFAILNGYDPLKLGMIWTLAAGGKIFVYQSGVLALGYSFGAFSAKDLFKLGLILIIVESLLVAFLVPIYWNLIGV